MNEINVDTSEYKCVFQILDKNNTGEINIAQVSDLLGELESSDKDKNGHSKKGGANKANSKEEQSAVDSEDETMYNYGNVPGAFISPKKKPVVDAKGKAVAFPNGKSTLKFDEFIKLINDSCRDKEKAENYLIHTFALFDREKKGYIQTEDLKKVFELLGEKVNEEEIQTMVKIAGTKSNDKINFKEFCEFFYKDD